MSIASTFVRQRNKDLFKSYTRDEKRKLYESVKGDYTSYENFEAVANKGLAGRLRGISKAEQRAIKAEFDRNPELKKAIQRFVGLEKKILDFNKKTGVVAPDRKYEGTDKSHPFDPSKVFESAFFILGEKNNPYFTKKLYEKGFKLNAYLDHTLSKKAKPMANVYLDRPDGTSVKFHPFLEGKKGGGVKVETKKGVNTDKLVPLTKKIFDSIVSEPVKQAGRTIREQKKQSKKSKSKPEPEPSVDEPDVEESDGIDVDDEFYGLFKVYKISSGGKQDLKDANLKIGEYSLPEKIEEGEDSAIPLPQVFFSATKLEKGNPPTKKRTSEQKLFYGSIEVDFDFTDRRYKIKFGPKAGSILDVGKDDIQLYPHYLQEMFDEPTQTTDYGITFDKDEAIDIGKHIEDMLDEKREGAEGGDVEGEDESNDPITGEPIDVFSEDQLSAEEMLEAKLIQYPFYDPRDKKIHLIPVLMLKDSENETDKDSFAFGAYTPTGAPLGRVSNNGVFANRHYGAFNVISGAGTYKGEFAKFYEYIDSTKKKEQIVTEKIPEPPPKPPTPPPPAPPEEEEEEEDVIYIDPAESVRLDEGDKIEEGGKIYYIHDDDEVYDEKGKYVGEYDEDRDKIRFND